MTQVAHALYTGRWLISSTHPAIVSGSVVGSGDILFHEANNVYSCPWPACLAMVPGRSPGIICCKYSTRAVVHLSVTPAAFALSSMSIQYDRILKQLEVFFTS